MKIFAASPILILLLSASSLASPKFVGNFGSFEYYSDIDSMSDVDQSFVATGPDDNYLLWKCDGRQLNVIIHTENYLNDDDPIPTTYRIDKRPAVGPVDWNPSTTGTSAFMSIERVTGFTKQALLGKQIAIRVANYDSRTYDYSFSLNGLKTALSKLQCARGKF